MGLVFLRSSTIPPYGFDDIDFLTCGIMAVVAGVCGGSRPSPTPMPIFEGGVLLVLDPIGAAVGEKTIFVIERGGKLHRILRSLYFLRGLGTVQVHKLHYRDLDADVVYGQMRLFRRHGFIASVGRLYAGPRDQGWGQSVWVLGRRGYGVLGELDDLPPAPAKGVNWWIRPLGRKGRHLMGVNDIYVRLVLGSPDLNSFEWVTYPRGHVYYRGGSGGVYGAGKAYPDAVVSWGVAGETRRLFLEYDRGTETLGRIKEKIEHLRESVLKQVPGSLVLFACEGRIRGGNIGYLIRDRGLEDRMTVCEAGEAHRLIGAMIGEKGKKEEQGEASWLKLLSVQG